MKQLIGMGILLVSLFSVQFIDFKNADTGFNQQIEVELTGNLG